MNQTSSRIRWGRIVIAAVMSEVGVIAALFAGIAVYTWMNPSMSDAQSSTLGEEVGYYVAPGAGAVTTFLAALWATRGLSSSLFAHGALVGIVSVLLTVGFIASARPDHRVMYVIAFALRLAAGCLAGAIAERRSGTRLQAVQRSAR
jgi:hypothetical protein